MKKTICALVFAVTALSAAGCSLITSSQGANTTHTGEAWYVKVKWFIIPYSNEVYYCDGKSNVCKEAEIQ